DPRPFERFALPMNVDEVRQALDNSEVGKMLAQRPKFSKMLNEMPPEMKAALEQIDKAFQEHQKQQGISVSEIPENGVKTQSEKDTTPVTETPPTLSGSPETEKQGTTTPESSETVAVSQDLSGQPETVSDSLKEPVNTQECLALLLNADDSSLNNYDKQYRQLLSFAVENGFSLIEDEKIGAFHFEKSQSVFYANNSRNHLSVFVGCKDQYGRVLETKHWKSSEFADPDIPPELKNAPEFNTGNEHQDWENWLNSPEYHSLKVSGFVGAVIQELPNEWLKLAKQELAEAENQFNLLEKFYPDEVKGIEYRREQVELQKKEVERLERLVEKQGVSASGISETVAVSQDLTGQPETQVPVVLTKEEKAQLKAAKDDLTVAKKELKDLRDKLKNTRPDPMSDYLQWKEEKRQAISQKQSEVRERSHQYDELSFAFKTKTGEITDLEKEILTARLSGSLKERFNIAFRELKAQQKEIGVQYNELKARIDNKDLYEFEIQSVMQDAVAYYGGSHGMAMLYHKGEPLPLTTDRDKAIAYL
ncbi:MAG: hypothetical protein J6W29_06640, partial [Neisseriaceae bacterium]|nr:hypothetical protein [Neisseriaceae bacterium]